MIETLLAALQILLTLTAPTSGPAPDGCSIERKLDSGAYQEIVSNQPCSGSYTDNITSAPTTVTYRSRSSLAGVKSQYSAEVTVSIGTTQPPPTGGSPLPPGYTFYSPEYGRMEMKQAGTLAFGNTSAGYYFRTVPGANETLPVIIYCQKESFPGAPYIGNPHCEFKAS